MTVRFRHCATQSCHVRGFLPFFIWRWGACAFKPAFTIFGQCFSIFNGLSFSFDAMRKRKMAARLRKMKWASQVRKWSLSKTMCQEFWLNWQCTRAYFWSRTPTLPRSLSPRRKYGTIIFHYRGSCIIDNKYTRCRSFLHMVSCDMRWKQRSPWSFFGARLFVGNVRNHVALLWAAEWPFFSTHDMITLLKLHYATPMTGQLYQGTITVVFSIFFICVHSNATSVPHFSWASVELST